jgi:hypothetical protein
LNMPSASLAKGDRLNFTNDDVSYTTSTSSALEVRTARTLACRSRANC